MDKNELTGEEFESLSAALRDAYRTPADLRRMVREKLNEQLDEFTEGNLRQRVSELVSEAESRGWTRRLVEGAYKGNPGNPALKRFYLDFQGSVQRSVSGEALERIVSASGTLENIVTWREKLAQIELQVCRVEVAAGAIGTGFLVAPDVILTNYHVIENREVSAVSVRFDHKLLADGTTINSGKVYKALGPVIDESPYSQLDLVYPRSGVPTLAELDYAFLRIDGQAGAELVGGVARGFIKPAPGDPPSQGLMFIVQHPGGKPMQVAFEPIIGLNANATRVTYQTDTESGSSGSPAFDRDWNLTALHHGGDPRIAVKAKFNEGIPVDTIRRSLKPEIKALVGWT